MKTKELVKVIQEIIRKEVQKQVSEQVTRILQEQMHVGRIQQKPAPNLDFGVMYDEPIVSEATSPLLGMMSKFEYDEFGGNMHFGTQDMTTVNGILNTTAQQMQSEMVHGEGGPMDTSAFMKDYTKVLKASYDKSNGVY